MADSDPDGEETGRLVDSVLKADPAFQSVIRANT
jgi:hypothetical protein